MIIRSQDKKSITTDLNINIYADDEEKGFELINKSLTSLGTYSTEEKAIKVLDMICEAYVKSQALYIDRENNAKVITQNIAIQMPSDEEVEV